MPKKKKEDLLLDEAANSVAVEQMPEVEENNAFTEAEAAGTVTEPELELSQEQNQEQETETAVTLVQETVNEEPWTEGGLFLSAPEVEAEELPFAEENPVREQMENPPQSEQVEDQSDNEETLLSVPSGKKKTLATVRKGLYALNLHELDRGLSEEQQQEWNNIYASYRSKSIITGTSVGVDQYSFDILNHETQELEKKKLNSLIIIDYRVKVLIPESEIWLPGEERPGHVLRNMVGSRVDYIIMDVDREGECAVGSRRMAMAAKRRFFLRNDHKEGELLKCRVMAVGAKRCTVECNGYDIHLTQRDLSYTAIADLRAKYHPGQELTCLLKGYDKQAGRLKISVKETTPNPFIGADIRHPPGSRRQATISGKYAGGVFCTLSDDTVCLCYYSPQHSDAEFRIGDSVIVLIRRHDYDRQLIYGRILAKW